MISSSFSFSFFLISLFQLKTFSAKGGLNRGLPSTPTMMFLTMWAINGLFYIYFFVFSMQLTESTSTRCR